MSSRLMARSWRLSLAQLTHTHLACASSGHAVSSVCRMCVMTRLPPKQLLAGSLLVLSVLFVCCSWWHTSRGDRGMRSQGWFIALPLCAFLCLSCCCLCANPVPCPTGFSTMGATQQTHPSTCGESAAHDTFEQMLTSGCLTLGSVCGVAATAPLCASLSKMIPLPMQSLPCPVARARAVVPPGYFLKGPGQVAPCPAGEWKSGVGAAANCVKCAFGVTTASIASTSADACQRE